MEHIINNCQLEVDVERGVIYVHHPAGFTALRISRIDTEKLKLPPSPEHLIDLSATSFRKG